MLLFKKRFHDGLVSGAVSLTFRRWKKPKVKPGGRYRCHPIGVLEVDSIDLVRVDTIKDRDARRSGFSSAAELIEYLGTGPSGLVDPDTEVYRVALHHGGDGDRVEIALDDQLGPDDVKAISARLAKMDSTRPWTQKTLALIRKNPRTAASKLAAKLRVETAPLKADVRKLKKLGLTQSFEVGYEISPRGVAYLALRSAHRIKR
jgi:hypothetical protein